MSSVPARGSPTSGVLSRLAALAATLPFIFALTTHHDPQEIWWNVALWTLIGAIFLAAQFAARQGTRFPGGERVVAAFAVLSLVLGMLGFASAERFTFAQAATDFALLYLVFFAAAAATKIAGRLGRALLALLITALALTAIVQAVHLRTFGFAVGPDGYRAILQSNPAEALEFVGRFVDASALVTATVALVVALVAALGALPLRLSREALGWAGTYGLAAFAIVVGNSEFVTPRAQGLAQTFSYVVEAVEYRVVRYARGTRGPQLAIAQQGPLAGQPQTYVFIIGESLNRNHMSLYGYWRETTPALARLTAQMAIFTDTISPHSHTDQSLERILTLANHDNGMRFTDAANYSLIELLRAAGFQTWWISNQNSFGPWDNKTAALGAAAERLHYTGARSGAMVVGPHDEALLEPFMAALRDPAPRKVIFLHFLGNHWEYVKRYPPQAATFRNWPSAAEIGALSDLHARPALINHYDNAVRYHDQLAAQIIEYVRATRKPAVVTLFSDHGESVYGLKGHYWKQFTADHVEVPLLLWFSPEYVALAGNAAARARANAASPFALEDLPHLVGDLAGLRSPLFEPQRSPLSDAYRPPQERRLFEGSLIYERADDARLNVRRALERVAKTSPELRNSLWAHRVNTLAKMREAAQLFSGVEIDVVYDPDKRVLMVHHPPQAPSGLTLEAQLAYADRIKPGLGLWLDLKNLNETNAARVLAELDRLDSRHAIRARALVETDHSGPAAALLRKAGYRTSYYLPTVLLTQNAGADSAFSCYGAAQIEQAVVERGFAAISYDWRGHPWVERCLGRVVRARKLRRYAWDLEPFLSERILPAALSPERLRQYGEMSAILLPYRSPFEDWK